MSTAEKFIREYTRRCSNVIRIETQMGLGVETQHWLTPDQARRAVEIAREEIYEWLRVNLCNYFDATREDYDMCIDDLKQAMKEQAMEE